MAKFSILIPLLIQHEYQFNMTRACIENIHGFTKNYEIVLLHSLQNLDVGKYKPCGKYIKDMLRKQDTYLGFDNNPSQAEALNIGIGKAKGEYIILIGNDNFVHQNWLDEIEKRLGDPNCQILACTVDRLADREKYKDQNYISYSNFSYLNFQGLTIPKWVLDEVGLFDENLPFYLWEMDYNRRLEAAGITCGGVLDSLMTTPQNMTRMNATLPDGVENWWTDEAMAKEQDYFLEKHKVHA